ncbi:HAD-IIIA family hydrolase [Candidatus Woesearchaeota archaeon]|jgi:HAD superfamily hydrolase (TIGR01662 family)|nr:HAD-IIIA family hydrolase [Candidatus Woesearchaeota archaeon]MBT6519586.1 HAD-IIIA family hydrolase [Candidatus Woesearchaeota archaeon]MBT7367669.1 HAD-IIIA family hydrolase [Candidatus Woesearchaeota archaeon]
MAPISCTFTAYGHENILSTHRNTLEIIKSKELSKNGDCIVATGANFSYSKLKPLLKYKKLKLILQAGRSEEIVYFNTNPDYSSKDELVIRLSEFASERTLGVRSDKGSSMINRKFIKKIQKPKQKITFTIEPQIKAVVMDFDDTIEDFQLVKNKLYLHMSKILFEKYDIYPDSSLRFLNEIDEITGHKGMHGSPKFSDRHRWFKELFDFFGIKFSKQKTKTEIDFLVKEFWGFVDKNIKMFPHAIKILKELKKKYFLIIMSDSDGTKEIKLKRMKKLGILDLFDIILTSDDTNLGKPNMKFYNSIFKKFKLKPEECIMMGDKPEVDLELAKKIGMRTVWVKHGDWAKSLENKRFDYIDYEIRGYKNFFKDVDVL